MQNVKELMIDMGVVEKMKDFVFLAAQLRACGIVLVANEEAVNALKEIGTNDALMVAANLFVKTDDHLKHIGLRNIK